MVTTHISTFVTAGFYWTSNVVSNVLLFVVFSFSIMREKLKKIFQNMHIVMLSILVVALMREEIWWNKTLGIFINKSLIKKKTSCLLYLCTVM